MCIVFRNRSQLVIVFISLFLRATIALGQAPETPVENQPFQDSVAERAQTQYERLQSLQPFPLTKEKWEAVEKEILPATVPGAIQYWDIDHNDLIDLSEVQRGVEIAYGVRGEEGFLARSRDGQVFYGRLFQLVDANQNHVISETEFKTYQQRFPQIELNFQNFDLNGDGALDLSEIDQGGLFLVDLTKEFVRWDVDKNGRINASELQQRVRDHERIITPMILPAFDLNGDGELSLSEFQLSPLAEFSRSWNMKFRDLDGNGSVSLQEFWTAQTLHNSWLAADYFDRLDLDRDGELSVAEAALDLDLERIPLEVAVQFLDLDRDGELSRAEAFSIPSQSPLQGPVYPQSEVAFQSVDQNQDDRLSLNEAITSPDLLRVLQNERWAREKEKEYFRADRNQNHRLDFEELQTMIPAARHPRLKQEFVVFDFDGNGELTFNEYLCLTDIAPVGRRGLVPDPAVDLAESQISFLMQEIPNHDANMDEELQLEEWTQATRQRWYGPYFRDADRDQNGSLTVAEIRLLFETAYGVRDSKRLLLRRETGHVFNWRFPFIGWDPNQDELVTRDDFVRGFSQDKALAMQVFHTADKNADGTLDLAELLQIETLWIDVVSKFLNLDTDRNGLLSPAELDAKVQSWERVYLPWLFPACDTNGDGFLSLYEFRGSPLGNSVLVWDRIRRDAAADGLVELAEFHTWRDVRFLGLTKMIFDQLDRDQNQSLDLHELDFDWDRIPAELLLSTLDVDQDNRLTRAEAFSKGDTPAKSLYATLFEQLADPATETIDLAEIADHELLALAIKSERWSQHIVLPLFIKRDLNQDGALSLEELVIGVSEKERAEVEYVFRIFDFDANQLLSLSEFSALQSRKMKLNFGLIPDPVQDRVESILHSILPQLSANSLSLEQLFLHVEPHVPGLKLIDFYAWKKGESDHLSMTDVRRGLEIAYGIRNQKGERIRYPNGTLLYYRSLLAWDKNVDGVVDREELIAGLGTNHGAETASGADLNQDGQLSIAESFAVPGLWKDVVTEFLRFDTDRDGSISPEELAAQGHPWEQGSIKLTWPAFDTDVNGSLSFREFRETPLANPIAFWEKPRTDQDYDGKLSLQEFHDSASYWRLGLSGLIYSRLDRDGDHSLSRKEIEFRSDLSKVPLEMAFALLDQNGDRQLSLAEALQQRPEKPTTPEGIRSRQAVLSRIEDAFYLADRDRNGELSISEFTGPQSPIALLATGRPTPAPRAGERYLPQSSPSESSREEIVANRDWRFIGLIAFNVILILGISYFVLKPSKSH